MIQRNVNIFYLWCIWAILQQLCFRVPLVATLVGNSSALFTVRRVFYENKNNLGVTFFCKCWSGFFLLESYSFWHSWKTFLTLLLMWCFRLNNVILAFTVISTQQQLCPEYYYIVKYKRSLYQVLSAVLTVFLLIWLFSFDGSCS